MVIIGDMYWSVDLELSIETKSESRRNIYRLMEKRFSYKQNAKVTLPKNKNIY